MSLNPPTRRISPLTMPNFDDERMLMFRVPSMDSSVAFSEASSVGPWVCPQCSYSNVDSGNDRCALCGREDRDHHEKKAAKKSRKSSWLSLGNAINGGSSPSPKFRNSHQQLEEVKEDSIMPPPTEPQKKQTSLGLPSKNAMPISRRPDREAPEGDDAEPTISLPKRIPNSPTQNSGPPALMGNSLAASFLRAESINSQSEQNDGRSARTARTTTSHSRDESVRTIRISNAKAKAPAGDSPPSTPPMSNKSISNSTCTSSPERSVSAPPLGTMPNTGTDGDQLTVPTLRQRHSDTMSDKRNNNLFHPACQSRQEDDLEQPSYLPSSIRTTNAGRDTRGHNSSNSTTSTSSTRLVPPARKSSGPPTKVLPDPYNYVQSESNSKNGGKSKRKTKDTQKRKGVKQNVNNTKSDENDKFINDRIIPSRAITNNKNPTSKDNNVSVHTIATHETTPRNSFTSASFADERSIETGWSEDQQARVPVPFEVMAPGDDNDGGGGGGGDDDDGIGQQRHVAKSRVKVFCLLGTALLVVSAVVAFLVTKVFMEESEIDATNTEVSAPTTISLVPSITPAPATSSPTLAPTAVKSPPPIGRPGTMILEPLTTIDGNVGEQFGLVVSSVTGTGSDWVAVGGINFVRIFRLEDDHFVQVGDDLTNNNKMLFQVSLASNDHVAIATIAWQEELTIWQLDSSDNKWNDVFTLDDFDSEDIISTAMSTNGRRFVVAVVSPDSSSAVAPGSSSAKIDIYYWNSTNWGLEDSFEVGNPDEQMIQLEISHTGESIVALASGRVVSYLFDDMGVWARDNIPAGSSNNVTALSGDGRVCTVANPYQMLTVVYEEMSQGWARGPLTAEQGIHAMALDHSGHLLAVTTLMDTKLGSVSLWYQVTNGAGYMSIDEIGEMDSGFGTSVAMTNSDSGGFLVVGAPARKNAGRVHFYKIQEVGGNGK